MLDDIMYCPGKKCRKPILVKVNSTIIQLQPVKSACRWVSQQICQSCDKPSAKALHVSCPRMLSQPLETVNHIQKYWGKIDWCCAQPWTMKKIRPISVLFTFVATDFQQIFKSTKTHSQQDKRGKFQVKSNYFSSLELPCLNQYPSKSANRAVIRMLHLGRFLKKCCVVDDFAWSVVWKKKHDFVNVGNFSKKIKVNSWVKKIWCTLYRRTFQQGAQKKGSV